VAAGAAARTGAQVTGKAAAKGVQTAGKAAARGAAKGAKGAARSAGSAAKGAGRTAAKGAGQTAAKGAGQTAGNAAKGAARNTARGAAHNAARPALRGNQAAAARARGGAGNATKQAAKQANKGSKLPEKPSKQIRRAVNNARDGQDKGKDDKRNRRRGPVARQGHNLRKDLAKQARGGKEREQDGAEEAAEEIARRTGRRAKRLLFLDRDQFFRRTVRRTLIVFVLVVLLLAYPAMTIWASTATDHEPEEVLDDGLLSSMANGLGAGPIPEALMPAVAEATGIPIEALRAYSSSAGGEWPIDWRIMAGIGKVECDHGRSTALYCSTPHNVWNYGDGSGERGPMQHLGHLWRVGENDPMDPHVEGPPTPVNRDSTHVATDGSGDGIADPWNWFDATHSAARKLSLYRDELRAKGDAYDTDEFMIAAYNAGVGGSTSNGSDIADIPNKDYLDKVLAERDRIHEATAALGFTVGGTACPVVVPRGPTKALNPGHVTPATAAMANNTVGCFGNEYSVGCYNPRDGTYEHPRGRACDFMITAGGNLPDTARRVHGTAMAEWHMNNATNFNLLYVIWYGKIWSVDRDGTPKPWSQWRTYTTGGNACSSPSSCGVTAGHYDHVHVSVKLLPGDPGYAHCPHSNCSE
jgi:hypothetical protein